MVDLISQSRGVITWTSPKGNVFNLKTTESGYKRKHVGTVKENPKTAKSSTKKITDSNDTFSDLGMAGRDVNLDFIFIGENHSSDASSFEAALCEVGKSRLMLDYGDELTVNVIDFSVKRDLLKNINSTIVSVNFHETSKTNYPETSKSGKNEIKNASEKTNEIVAQKLADSVLSIQNDSGRMQKFASAYSKMMNNVSSALSTANNVSLNSIMTDIMGQDVMSNALTMTSQMQIVMSKAAALTLKVKNSTSDFELPEIVNSTTGSSSVLGSWENLINSLMVASYIQTETGLQKSDIDNLLINDVSAVSALSALSQSAVNVNFATRKEAVETAKGLIQLEEKWTEFIEDKLKNIKELNDAIIRDSGIVELVATACGEILKQSYELKVEKTIVLSEDKTVLELVAEHYPEDFQETPDETMSYFIKSNDLSDDEFLIIKRGSEVKIYV